ncbi:MAG TPA: PAS domain S-box protein [Bryobacteraceae bacterium]|nr:PAS domain S-box protein [Bryobacteraceae bacterium]
MTPNISPHRRSMIEAKLQLAEQALAISNRIVQLTTEIFIRGGRNVEELVHQQLESFGKIRSLVQKIEEHLESKKEEELFSAASARWTSVHRYEQSLHAIAAANKLLQVGTTTADVVLPLLLDNFSWRAFIEYLRADLDSHGNDWEAKSDIAARAADLVRANQELKSKIAERKRIEERLSQISSIIESSSDAIIIHTLAGTVVSWNNGAERLYGYAAGEVLGRSGSMLLPVGRRDELPAMLENFREGEPELYETVHVRKDGEQFDVSTAISAVKDASGRIVGAAAITRDISDRKRAEERFYKAFHANPEPIAITTLPGDRYFDVNESFLRVTGCALEDVTGRSAGDFNFWQRPQDRAALLKALETHGSVRAMETTILTREGRQRIGLISAEIIEIGGEKCAISIFHDVTEQKQLENQLRREHVPV